MEASCGYWCHADAWYLVTSAGSFLVGVFWLLPKFFAHWWWDPEEGSELGGAWFLVPAESWAFSVSSLLEGLTNSLTRSVPKGAVLGADFHLYCFALKERKQLDSGKGNPIKPSKHPQILVWQCHCVGWRAGGIVKVGREVGGWDVQSSPETRAQGWWRSLQWAYSWKQVDKKSTANYTAHLWS